MSAGNKCSLILMWDDGRTRRVRLRLGVIRFIAVMWAVLVAAGGAGIWIGWKAFRHMQVWEGERRLLEREVAENSVRLERLANMEALYARTLPTPAADSPQQPPLPDPAEFGPAAASAPVSNPAKTGSSPAVPDTRASSGTPATATPDESVQSASATTPAQPSSSVSSVSPVPSATPDKTPADPENAEVNTGVVRVENVRARLDERRFRISVDLYNGDAEGRQISGKAVITLIDADGRTLPVVSDNMLFRIVRFKKLAASVPLTTPTADAGNAVVRVEVYVNDRLEYRNTFPVEIR